MTPVSNKTDMYRRLWAGEFGNTMQVFSGLDDAMRSGVTPLGVRSVNNSDQLKIYWCPRSELLGRLNDAGAMYRNDLIFYSTDYGMEKDRVIQGELQRDERGLSFFHTFEHQPMRVALANSGSQARGLCAEMILRRHVRGVDPAGYDWLHDLLDQYPGHVVEFTTYRRPVGTHPARTLIWEVRCY